MRNSRNFSMPPISSNVNNNSSDKPPDNLFAPFTEATFQKTGALMLGDFEEGQVDKFIRNKNSDTEININIKKKESS